MKTLYKNLYKKIYKIRSVESKISQIYRQQEIRCPVHLSIGQEAVAAGICENLTKNEGWGVFFEKCICNKLWVLD